MCPFEGEVLAARIVDSFFSVTSIPVLCFSTSCLPPCPVFVLALFLWPLQWSVATAELLVSTQLRCITRPGVPASYLAPGVVFVCVHLRRKSSFMHALSLGPHTQGLGLLYLATSTPCMQHNGVICGGVVLSCLTLQQEKCEIKFTGRRRSLLSFSSIFKPSLDVKYKLARWLFSFHFHNPILMFLICVTELSLSFCWISVVSQEPLCP